MAVTTSRKTARQKLADLLDASLVTSLGIVQAVYDYRIGDFQGQSPVVVVSSGGSRRTPLTFQGLKPGYRLLIHVFVVYNTEDGLWNEQDAENRLDDIEEAVYNVIAANDGLDGFWNSLEVNGETITDSMILSGVEYRTEIFEVSVA